MVWGWFTDWRACSSFGITGLQRRYNESYLHYCSRNVITWYFDYLSIPNGQLDILFTNEKRIYAPNIVVVKDGKAITLTSGISEKQTNGYMELTDEMIEDMKNNFDNIIKILDK